jgi:HlyD family secretion protein
MVDRGPLQSVVEGEGKTRVRQRYVVSATIAGRLARVSLMENDVVHTGQIVAHIDPLPLLSAIAQDEAKLGELEAQRSGVFTLRPKAEAIQQARARLQAANANQRAAQAQFAQADAELRQTIRDRDRANTLYRSGYIPLADLERTQLSVTTRQNETTSASLNVKAAKARVAEADQAVGEVVAKVSDPEYLIGVYDSQSAAIRADLVKLHAEEGRTVLRSPVNGRVLRILQKSEQYVSAGTPVLEIGDPKTLELVIELLSTDAADVSPGALMSVDDGSGTWRYQGRVRYIEPSAFTKISALGVEEQRVNVIGDLKSPHAALGDGYRLEARIVTWHATDVLRVPSAALYRCGDGWCVFAVKQARAREYKVRVAHIGEDSAQVLTGLAAGEQVIVHPSDKIVDGVAVTTS